MDTRAIHTHYIFLIHGWLGNSSEMGYLESAIQRYHAEKLSSIHSLGHENRSHVHDTTTTNNNNNNRIHDGSSRASSASTTSEDSSMCTILPQPPPLPRIVTYSARANDAKTTDGIANGGTRLAQEIQEFIQEDILQQLDPDGYHTVGEDVTTKNVGISVGISFVGNSLGGLYARYALSLLPSQIEVSSPSCCNLTIQLCPEIFATTATPHLGVSGHTYLPLPRTMERIVGHVLQSTGRDLFRVYDDDDERDQTPDLIYQMSTNYERFLRPLRQFRKRVAYANAFRTDFQVPTSTAAFLSKQSSYPQGVWVGDGEGEQQQQPEFVVAVVETERNGDVLMEDVEGVKGVGGGGSNSDSYRNSSSIRCKKHAMSVKLDSLGWTKVFVDVREYIPLPGFALPSFVTRGSRERWNDFLNSCPIVEGNEQGKTKRMVQSKDLDAFMSSSDRIDIPVGHQVMVANSKNPSYSSFTSKGRPVMDYFAQWLVRNLYENET